MRLLSLNADDRDGEGVCSKREILDDPAGREQDETDARNVSRGRAASRTM